MTYGAIGLLLTGAISLVDYRKLQKYSVHMYVGVLLVMAGTFLFGTTINGKPYFSLGKQSIDFISLSPFLLLVAVAGIASSDWWKNRLTLTVGLFVIPPCVAYIAFPGLTSLVIYFCCVVGLLVYARGSWKPLLYMLPFAVTGLAAIFMNQSHAARLLSFINPNRDPQGTGYVLIQSTDAIRSAGWLGHGIGAVMDKLPAVQSEFMFSYLVYCFGWLGGLTLCFVVLSFLMRFAYVLRRIGDPYGALIVLGLLIAFMIQFVWSILMTMSLLPFVGYSLPFISSGGAMMTLQLALIGVVISIYRRKHYYMYTNNNHSLLKL